MKQRFTVIPAVYIIFRDGSRVLLLQRANTGYMDGMYGLPSGHVDGNEPAVDAAVREAKEEAGVVLDRKDLELVHTMHRQVDGDDRYGHERIDLFFQVRRWRGEPKNTEPHKCSELRWCDLDSLPEDMIPEVAVVLGKVQAGEHYSDYNFKLTS
jgi:8-oxo-dGTP diphosphatase